MWVKTCERVSGPCTPSLPSKGQYGLNDPRLKKINWNDAEPVKGKLTVSTQHLNLDDFKNQNLASSFERLENFSKE